MDHTTHYSLAQRTPLLAKHAEKRANDLRKIVKPNFLPVFLYTGMSGISNATALSLSYYPDPFRMFYVRKPRESSHGNDVEHSFDFDERFLTLVFVDDTVESGATRARVFEAFFDWIKTRSTFNPQIDKDLLQSMEYGPILTLKKDDVL